MGKRGAKPLSKISSPSPLKERGIKGVRLRPRGLKPEGLINNLVRVELDFYHFMT